MDLRQLEMFLAVAENLSFTRASQHLHVVQSAISRQIRLLEEELGETIFKRVNKRRVYLTPAGEVLLRYARRILLDVRNAAIDVSQIGDLQGGKLRVAAGIIACVYLLPPIFERFRELYPKVDLDIITGPTETLISELRNNRIDLGVLTLPIQFPDLEVIPLCSEEMVVVTSTKHRTLSKRRSLRAVELADYPLILFGKGARTRILLDDFFQEIGISPRVSMDSENVATIKALVEINLGITIVPLRAVTAERKRKELHYLRISDYRLQRQIGLVFQKTDHLPKVVSEMIRLLKQLKRKQLKHVV